LEAQVLQLSDSWRSFWINLGGDTLVGLLPEKLEMFSPAAAALGRYAGQQIYDTVVGEPKLPFIAGFIDIDHYAKSQYETSAIVPDSLDEHYKPEINLSEGFVSRFNVMLMSDPSIAQGIWDAYLAENPEYAQQVLDNPDYIHATDPWGHVLSKITSGTPLSSEDIAYLFFPDGNLWPSDREALDALLEAYRNDMVSQLQGAFPEAPSLASSPYAPLFFEGKYVGWDIVHNVYPQLDEALELILQKGSDQEDAVFLSMAGQINLAQDAAENTFLSQPLTQVEPELVAEVLKPYVESAVLRETILNEPAIAELILRSPTLAGVLAESPYLTPLFTSEELQAQLGNQVIGALLDPEPPHNLFTQMTNRLSVNLLPDDLRAAIGEEEAESNPLQGYIA
jgi:hypothetical protein